MAGHFGIALARVERGIRPNGELKFILFLYFLDVEPIWTSYGQVGKRGRNKCQSGAFRIPNMGLSERQISVNG
jgi:hypothetical protein